MSKGIKLAILIIFVLIAALAASRFEQRESIINEGPSLSVKRNQFYAAGVYLQNQGLKIEHSSVPISADRLGPSDTLLLTGNYEFLDRQSATALLNWVERGGNLIWEYSNPDEPSPLAALLGISLHYSEVDFQSFRKTPTKASTEPLSPRQEVRSSISRFEQRLNPAALSYFNQQGSDLSLQFYIPGSATLNQSMPQSAPRFQELHLTGEGRSEYVTNLLSLQLGQGRLSVVPNSSLWSNRRIGQLDHAHLLWQLTRTHDKVFIQRYLNWPTLTQLALSYAPEALLMLGLMIVAWIMQRAVRFGPLQLTRESQRRAISEHIQATARFHRRFGQHDYLLAPLRRAIERKMQHSHAQFNQLDKQQQIELIARISKLDSDQVNAAMTPLSNGNDSQFLAHIKLLVKIRNAL